MRDGQLGLTGLQGPGIRRGVAHPCNFYSRARDFEVINTYSPTFLGGVCTFLGHGLESRSKATLLLVGVQIHTFWISLGTYRGLDMFFHRNADVMRPWRI